MVVAHAYENDKTMEQYRQEARKTSVTIRRNFEDWRGIMEKSIEVTDYDELVYKLTLKYLQQKWCDIGNNTIPRVKRLTFACKTILLFFTALKTAKAAKTSWSLIGGSYLTYYYHREHPRQ